MASTLDCSICSGKHQFYRCDIFLKQSPEERFGKCKSKGLCINCVVETHRVNKCKARGCIKCNKKHNTLLHRQPSEDSKTSCTSASLATATPSTGASLTAVTTPTGQNKNDYVILATAVIEVKKLFNQKVKCRVLLDSGSQVNLITERFYKKL